MNKDKDTTNTTINKFIERVNVETFSKIVNVTNLDRYMKKLTCHKFLKLMIYAQLTEKESLTALAEDLNDSDDLKGFIGLTSISKSSLSRHLSKYSPDVFDEVLHYLVQEIQKQWNFQSYSQAIKKLSIIDSSTISMCFSQYPWAAYRQTKAGVKIHLRVNVMKEMTTPDKLVLLPAVHADRTQMESLVEMDPNCINLFDRAYNDYKLYDEYCDKEIPFITRLKENAVYEIISAQRVATDLETKRDVEVFLGTTYNRMKHSLRVIETTDSVGKRVLLLTNCFHMSALEIGALYRERWRIETFFKWMKQHLRLKSLYGKSQNAVYNQILIALITYCLFVLFQIKLGYKGKLLRIKRCLLNVCFKTIHHFVKILFRSPTRTSKGRKKYDYELEYDIIMNQYKDGEVEHLNSLTLDPLID